MSKNKLLDDVGDFPKRAKNILVRYKLQNDTEEQTEWLTVSQYNKIKSLPIMEYCEIMERRN